MFMLDLGISFFSEYRENETIVRDLPKIMTHYLKSWFIIDFLAAFPFEWVLGTESYYSRMTRLFRMPRIVKLMKNSKLSGFIWYFLEGESESREERRKLIFILRHIGNITRMLIGLIFLNYIAGCLWFWYSERSGEDNWVTYYNLENETSLKKMVLSFYFILTTLTTVGYGDYVATNSNEYTFIIFLLIFGVGYFAYVMGNFNNAIINFDAMWSGEDNMANLNSWFLNVAKYKSKLPDHL